MDWQKDKEREPTEQKLRRLAEFLESLGPRDKKKFVNVIVIEQKGVLRGYVLIAGECQKPDRIISQLTQNMLALKRKIIKKAEEGASREEIFHLWSETIEFLRVIWPLRRLLRTGDWLGKDEADLPWDRPSSLVTVELSIAPFMEVSACGHVPCFERC